MTTQSKLELLGQLLLDNIGPRSNALMVRYKLEGYQFRLLFWAFDEEPCRRISVYAKHPKIGITRNAITVDIKSSPLLSLVEDELQLGLVYDYPK